MAPASLTRRAACLGAAALLAGCATTTDPQAVLRRAEAAMGGTQLRTLQFDGAGMGAVFGQAWRPGEAWPRVTYSAFTRAFDYETGSFREDFARSRAEPNGGGAFPLLGQGEQRANGLLRGTTAWNLAGPAPVPAPVAADVRFHDLWTSPHGVLKAALRHGATVRQEGGKSVASFTVPGKLRASAWIGANGLVERVDSVHPHPVTGDTAVTTVYDDYRDHGGVRFPARIRQAQGGFPVLDLQVAQVRPNVASPVGEVPALVTAFAERAVPERVADGVWFLAGGSHNSVLVEMADHLILVESPLYDGRAQAVLAAARQLAPGKPVRYVINSHHHFDHSGGLRAAAAEGAVVVTSELARPWFTQALTNPNALAPDALARANRPVRVEGVAGRRVFDDGRPVS